MSRKRLAWLTLAVVLAVAVACQTVASASQRAALFVAQSDAPRVAVGVDVLAGLGADSAAYPRHSTTAERRSVIRGRTTTRLPAVTTVATPATTFSTATSSTRHTCRSSGAPTPSRPAHCTIRTPTSSSCSCAATGQVRRCRSTTSSRWRSHGISAPATGPTTCGCGSPTIRRICSRWRAGPIRTRAIPNRRCGCRPTSPSAASTPWPFIAVLRGYGLPVDAPSAVMLRDAAATCPTS